MTTELHQVRTWLSRDQLAEELGVSTRTVDRWVADGMPSELWGARIRRFRLVDVHRWLGREAA